MWLRRGYMNAFIILVGKPLRERPQNCNAAQVHLMEIRYEDLRRMKLTQVRVPLRVLLINGVEPSVLVQRSQL